MAMVAEDIVLYPAVGGWPTRRRKQQRQQRVYKPEPSIFTCGTCKSVYSSSWFLVQHVQKTHGLKIYEEPRESSPPPSIPTRPIVVQPDKLLAEQLRGGKDSPANPRHSSSPFHSAKTSSRPHRSPNCSPRTGSGGDMFSFPTPFMPGAPRQPTSAWPYGRSPMGCEFPAMMHPELMMDQLRRLQSMVGADHPAIPSMPFLRPALDNQYSHSERLRLLAATGSTSPKHIPPHSSNSRKPDFTSPTQSTPPSAFTTPTSSATTGLHDSRQLKQCEFCSKQFRFASNLVLHRRLHTGEKPYSCPLCTFTSAQATKLRSHMRSHVTSPGSSFSPRDAKLSDSDIEDSEDFVQREADAEAAIRQLERDAKRHKEPDQVDEPTDLSRRSVDSSSPADDDVVEDRASLLTEVMMKTGLSNLPNYKEAFTAALAEVPNHNKSPQHHSSPKLDANEEKCEEGEIVHSPVKEEPIDVSEKEDSIHEMTDGDVEEENDDSVDESQSISSQRRSPHSHASSEYSSTAEPPEKRIKRETSPVLSSGSPSSYPGADHLFQRAAMEAAQNLYPGIWFPPTSSATGLPYSHFMHRAGDHPLLSSGSRLPENGVSPQASSAFSNSGSPKIPSPDPLGNSARRRNDTCEFCGKVFKNCSNLTVHRRSHTGEKPYKCQLCPYACAQSSKLTRHMRTHGRHGKDVYRCKFCCMPFSVPSTLEKHMRKCVENQQRAAAARHMSSPLAPPSTV